jgi:hypothetical protein
MLEKHIAGTKSRLAQLAGLAARTEAAERRIAGAAEDRRAALCADLDKLRPRVHLDPGAAEQYQALVLERGQIDTVLANARRVLGE